ncbi:hypothetical protein BH11ACT1_BH11ACT1_19350 [soil metagenome]
MPRPNRTRRVLAEVNLARRIAAERDARTMTNDGLAKRMTDEGCAMTGSAIFKIEKGEPRRRIVVDELVAFSKVFGVPIEELLLPPEVAAKKDLMNLVVAWNVAATEASAATARRDDAWDAITTYAQKRPEVTPVLEDIFETWAALYFDELDRGGAAALKMWELTGDPKWKAAITEGLDRG